jgi:hypothetical protein
VISEVVAAAAAAWPSPQDLTPEDFTPVGAAPFWDELSDASDYSEHASDDDDDDASSGAAASDDEDNA